LIFTTVLGRTHANRDDFESVLPPLVYQPVKNGKYHR